MLNIKTIKIILLLEKLLIYYILNLFYLLLFNMIWKLLSKNWKFILHYDEYYQFFLKINLITITPRYSKFSLNDLIIKLTSILRIPELF